MEHMDKLRTKLSLVAVSRSLSTIAPASTPRKFPSFKYLAIGLGGMAIFSFTYQAYKWIIEVPICPNHDREQTTNINNVLRSTAVLRNTDRSCTGNDPMKKVGAATGVNYKVAKSTRPTINSSTTVLLNDNEIVQRNLFDTKYMFEYFETLGDMLSKFDETRLVNLLTNKIGYYVFVCPECRSSITRKMASCTSYLRKSGLQNNAADVTDVLTEQTKN